MYYFSRPARGTRGRDRRRPRAGRSSLFDFFFSLDFELSAYNISQETERERTSRGRTAVDQRGPLWEKRRRGRRGLRGRRGRRGRNNDEMPQKLVLVVPGPDARCLADGGIGVGGDDGRVRGRIGCCVLVLAATAEGARREGEAWLSHRFEKVFFVFTCAAPKKKTAFELPTFRASSLCRAFFLSVCR